MLEIRSKCLCDPGAKMQKSWESDPKRLCDPSATMLNCWESCQNVFVVLAKMSAKMSFGGFPIGQEPASRVPIEMPVTPGA